MPVLPGCPPRAADVFVRDRVLALRASGRSGGARLSVVRLADVVDGLRPVTDRAWWAPDPADPRTDRGLRTDLVRVLLDGAGPGPLLAVSARGGPAEVLEQDLGWTESLAQAAELVEVPAPPLVVVTRWGWRCHPTGGHRTWRRLRDRGPVVRAERPRDQG